METGRSKEGRAWECPHRAICLWVLDPHAYLLGKVQCVIWRPIRHSTPCWRSCSVIERRSSQLAGG